MKNFASANKYLSAAFALAAIVAAGAVPASAQSRDHTGSMMPFYYDETGAQKTGAWSREEEAGTANLQAAQPAQPLYMYAGKHAPHHGARVH
jgi:fatty acid desaturase